MVCTCKDESASDIRLHVIVDFSISAGRSRHAATSADLHDDCTIDLRHRRRKAYHRAPDQRSSLNYGVNGIHEATSIKEFQYR